MIFKRDPDDHDNYVTLANELVANPKLSYKSKGILAYLLSKSKSWKPQVLDLTNHGTEGKSAIWSAFRELRNLGYAKMEYFRDKESGKMTGRGWIIRHTPKQSHGKTVTQKSRATGNQHITNEREETKRKNAASRPISSFGVDGKVKEDIHPYAPVLVEKFLNQFVYPNKFHLGTSHLPTGANAKAVQRRLRTKQKWTQSASMLLAQVGKDRALKAMKWYFEHYQDEWVGTYQAMTIFADNFFKVEKAMLRQIKQNPSPTKESPHCIYKQPKSKATSQWVDEEETY